MNQTTLLYPVLRDNLRYFIWRCFATILSGTPYLHNWHIEAVIHQLMEIQRGECRRRLINQPPFLAAHLKATNTRYGANRRHGESLRFSKRDQFPRIPTVGVSQGAAKASEVQHHAP
jgi:hypothetical protein